MIEATDVRKHLEERLGLDQLGSGITGEHANHSRHSMAQVTVQLEHDHSDRRGTRDTASESSGAEDRVNTTIYESNKLVKHWNWEIELTLNVVIDAKEGEGADQGRHVELAEDGTSGKGRREDTARNGTAESESREDELHNKVNDAVTVVELPLLNIYILKKADIS